MAGASLLTLLDDIATLLDDIAAMSKVAAKKTAGVLGDDLAVNAEQVSGVKAERELPVVWAVAKGSLLNKCIIVPILLLFSAFMPWIITPMLMMGGLYLCFEGAEKVWHTLMHRKAHTETETLKKPEIKDLVAYEKAKVKGAIRTDFILSLEIIVIALGTMMDKPFVTQAIGLSVVAIAMTLFVYGLVAVIVKIDDVGLHFAKQDNALKPVGNGLLWLAPALMKTLTFVGTLAMFLVGGGILVHGLEHYFHDAVAFLVPHGEGVVNTLVATGINGAIGLLVGVMLIAIHSLFQKKNA